MKYLVAWILNYEGMSEILAEGLPKVSVRIIILKYIYFMSTKIKAEAPPKPETLNKKL